MKLARNIYNADGRVLLGENYELTDRLIVRLQHMGIAYVYIQDSRTDDIYVPEALSSETRHEALSQVRTHFRHLMEDSFRKRGNGQMALGKDFRQVLNMIIDELADNTDAMVMLTQINDKDTYLYQHSLNVCIYAVMAGKAIGYNRDKLMTLGLGALLHDIGKTQIPLAILQKPGRLTPEEYEVIKGHSELGYLLLKDEPNIPLLSAHCAYQHHERLNGSGYPRGIVGDEIHELGQWVGIVDSYDAMTCNRVYRSAMLPHEALEVLYTGAGTLYDVNKLCKFRKHMTAYPLGMSVTLNSGERGVVVKNHDALPQRPIVRILEDADGQELKMPYEIDLSVQLSYMIVKINDQQLNDRSS